MGQKIKQAIIPARISPNLFDRQKTESSCTSTANRGLHDASDAHREFTFLQPFLLSAFRIPFSSLAAACRVLDVFFQMVLKRWTENNTA